MVEYNKVSFKLSNLQLSKLKTAVKNNEVTTLRINSKTFNSDNLPHELFLKQRQITKLRNNTENNVSADIKLSKAQISKNNNARRCFRINFRKINWSIDKNKCSFG